MVTNSAMLSTSERNNMGRERLLTCLAECGAETEPVVLLELQKAYFNKFDEYLNKAELRKFFSKGHIKQVFENFMPKDVEMATDVNATGSLFLKMKRPLEVAIADSPKTAPLLAVPNGSNHRPPPHLVPLPASEPSAASRKILQTSEEKFAIPANDDMSSQFKLPSNRKQVFSLNGGGRDAASSRADVLEDFIPRGRADSKCSRGGSNENRTLVAHIDDDEKESNNAKKEKTETASSTMAAPSKNYARPQRMASSIWKDMDEDEGETKEDGDGGVDGLLRAGNNEEADDDSELGDAALEDGYQHLLKTKQSASANSRGADIKPFSGRGEAVSAGKWTGGARGGAGRGYNGSGGTGGRWDAKSATADDDVLSSRRRFASTATAVAKDDDEDDDFASDRFRRHGDNNNFSASNKTVAAGVGGSLLEKKWAQERLEDDAVVTERLRNRKREQHQSVAATHYNDCWNGDDEVTTAAASRSTRASQQQRVAAAGTHDRRFGSPLDSAANKRFGGPFDVGAKPSAALRAAAKKAPYGGKERFHPPPPFAPNVMSSEDDEEEEGGEVKEKRKVASTFEEEEEDDEEEDDDEEEEGQMTNMSRRAGDEDDETAAAGGGHETTTPEELHDEETEEFYEKFAVGTSRNNKAKQTSWGESGSKKLPVNYFVGLISTVMCMLKNVTHKELDKKLASISPSGTYRAAFPSPADLLVFITNHCQNIQTFKVSKTEVALLWSERSDDLMSQLLDKMGKTIVANNGGNSQK